MFNSLSLLLSAVLAVTCIGCERREIQIEMVIPTGYRGRVTVAKNPESGDRPRIVGDVRQYVVPASGRLEVADISPFESWHVLRGRWSHGSVLPVNASAGVALHDLWSDEEYIYFYVGTNDEVAALRSSR